MNSPTPPARENESDLAYGERMARDRDQFLSQRDALVAALEKASPALSMARLQFALNGENYNARLIDELLIALRAARGDV